MKHLAIFISVLFGQWLTAQNTDQKVILITMDGYRWQELFTGADEGLISNGDFKGSGGLKTQFWANTAEERRKTLMPFVWGFIAKEGQIHGNRTLGSKVNLPHGMWFSYPGYNEILPGRADDMRTDHNDKINKPNTTVLELLNSTAEFKGKVFA